MRQLVEIKFQFGSSEAGGADFAEDFAPRFTGAGVALKFCERLVERLPLGRAGETIEQVGLLKFGEPGEKLGAVAADVFTHFHQASVAKCDSNLLECFFWQLLLRPDEGV